MFEKYILGGILLHMSTCVSLTSGVSDVKSGHSLDNYITILIGEVEMKSINQNELILIKRWKTDSSQLAFNMWDIKHLIRKEMF